MKPIFPKSINTLLAKVVMALGLLGGVFMVLVGYYLHPNYIEVGYRPVQPVAYSHALHAGELGMDCRYCHATVEHARTASIPATETCMNCHQLIRATSDKIQPLKKSWEQQMPLQWVRVHDLPDYVYFNHAVHVRAQIGCASCHGNVADMEVVQKVENLSMGWCLNCHRNPAPHIRPIDQITNTRWVPDADQPGLAQAVIASKNLNPPEACTACHY